MQTNAINGEAFMITSSTPHPTIVSRDQWLTDVNSLLDVTPYGRQQDFEDSPPGWPRKPTYG